MTSVGRQLIPATAITLQGRPNPPVASLGLGQAVGLGSIAGALVMHVTGRRETVGAEADAWPGANASPARRDAASVAEVQLAAAPLIVQSSSASDTVGGVGATSVLIEYIDELGWGRMAVAQMQGLAPASLIQVRAEGAGNDVSLVAVGPVGNVFAVQRMYSLSVGSTGTNVGVVSAYVGTATAADENAAMAASANITASSSFIVPRGFAALLSGVGYGTDRAEAGRVRVYTRAIGKPIQLWTTFEAAGGALAVPLSDPIRIAALGRFWLTFEKDGGGPDVNSFTVLQPIFIPDPSDPDPSPDLQAMPLG